MLEGLPAPVASRLRCGGRPPLLAAADLIAQLGQGPLGCPERLGAAHILGRLQGGHRRPIKPPALNGPCSLPRWGSSLEQLRLAPGLPCQDLRLSVAGLELAWPESGQNPDSLATMRGSGF